MAPIKFEEHIKDKLEKRTLQPAQDSWKTLANRLETHEKKNTNSLFWFIGIAASIVGIMVIAFQFFDVGATKEIFPVIVDAPVKTEILSEEKGTNGQITIEESVVVSEDSKINANTNTSVNDSSNRPTLNQVRNNSAENIAVVPNQKTPLNNVVVIQDMKHHNKSETVMTLSAEDLKVMEVVAQITKLKIEGIAVSDNDIDALLKQAEKEILRERIYNEMTQTVDADALLQDVELDIEKSFRTKVFETLKSKLSKVTTAVAERNY